MHNIEMHYGLLFISISLWGLSCIRTVPGDFYCLWSNPLVGLEAVLNLFEVGIGAHYLFL